MDGPWLDTDNEKNDHHGSGGQISALAKEKLHEDGNSCLSRFHPLLSPWQVQADKLIKSHIRII